VSLFYAAILSMKTKQEEGTLQKNIHHYFLLISCLFAFLEYGGIARRIWKILVE